VLHPTTELDARFSDPGATPTDWQSTLEVIEAAELFWLSTVRSDGRPHVTPLVSVWMDDAAFFATGPEEQKTANLASNPHVVLSTGSNDWQEGIDVMIEGRAERVTDRETLERLADLWREKWDGRWQSEPTEGGFRSEIGEPAHVYGVRPVKVLAFAKGDFGHTRHRFPG
jgi:nitroimidazol reductase NimA-like FMN-containing flavoprotein (pyridoxamine 5'-phosphate oxidase superfamily)